MIRPILITAFVTVAGLSILNVMASSEYAESGAKLKQIEQEKQTLIVENQVLEKLVLEKTSLTNLEQKADQLGFAKPAQVIAITDPNTAVASR